MTTERFGRDLLRAFAEFCEVSPATLRRWLDGEQSPHPTMQRALLDALRQMHSTPRNEPMTHPVRGFAARWQYIRTPYGTPIPEGENAYADGVRQADALRRAADVLREREFTDRDGSEGFADDMIVATLDQFADQCALPSDGET